MCQRELSVKGWNWGTATTKDQVLSWTHGYKEAFEIPLRNVKKCEVSNDNEVFLEFHEVRNKTVYVLLSFQISLFIPWPYFFPSNASVSVIFFNTMDHQLPATCWLYLLPLEDNQFQPWKKKITWFWPIWVRNQHLKDTYDCITTWVSIVASLCWSELWKLMELRFEYVMS